MRQRPPVLRDAAEIDPLDTQFGPVSTGFSRTLGRTARLPWLRTASPGGRVVLVLLPLGIAFGPHGLNILSPPVLAALDPVLSVIVGVLGVLIGLGLDLRRPHERILLVGASVEAAFAAVVVAAGAFAALALAKPDNLGSAPGAVAALIGLCAAVSALPAEPSPGAWSAPVARLRAMGSVLPIAVMGLVVAWFREGTAGAALSTMAQAGLVALTIAGAVWLLVGQTPSDSEQRVFAAGALLLVAGAADFLALSVLFAGLATGVVWQVLDGQARDHLARDTRYARHPMLAVLLLVAGASVDVESAVPLLLAAYVVCRTGGQIVGGWLVRRTLVPGLPREVGLHLASPGVVAIAMALDARGSAAAEAAGLLLPVVVFGTLASEILSLLFSPEEAARPDRRTP